MKHLTAIFVLLFTGVTLAQTPQPPGGVYVDPGTASRPPCDFTITTAAEFTSANVNNSANRVICVSPGVASTGAITLSTSGTQAAPRWLRLVRPDNMHPANFPKAEGAAIAVLHNAANWWVVDRISIRGATTRSLWSGSNSAFIYGVFEDRACPTPPCNGLFIELGGSGSNAIINSVFRTPWRSPGQDTYAVYISGGTGQKVIGNEIIAVPSGIQHGPGSGGGHIIASNEMYHNASDFVNCSTGAVEANGPCMCGEGFGFVAKGTGTAMSFVEGNFAWDFSQSANNCSGTGGGGGVAWNLGSGNGQTNNWTLRNNTGVGRVVGSSRPTYGIYVGLNASGNVVSENYIANTDHPIDALYGVNSTYTNNILSNNLVGSCILTGNGNTITPAGGTCPSVSGRSNGGTRAAATGERCVIKFHITNPTPVCYP